MDKVAARLKALSPTVNEICRVSGAVGASIGVLHHGEVVYLQGFGYRDIEKQLAPDENTVYYLASLSKFVTAAAVGMLVEEGKMQWDTPVQQLVEGFSQKDATVEKESTIVDWMSHRSGMASRNQTWTAEFGRAGMERRDTLPTIASLEKINEFRQRWVYSNWGWALADHVVESVSGQRWGEFLKSRVFDPLQMQRTTTDHNTSLDNVARAHQSMSDGKPKEHPRPFPADGQIMAGAVGVQSCVRDLLTLYKSTLEAWDDQAANGTTSTPGNPLKQVQTLLSAHMPLDPDSPPSPERSYALGWLRSELPAKLGEIGINGVCTGPFGGMPLVGKGMKENELILYHQGSNNTHLHSVHMIPRTHTAIVVLTNTLSNNDTADWLGEMFLEAMLDNSDKNDYLSYAQRSAIESVKRWGRMPAQLEEKRIPNTFPKPLDTYCGVYTNRLNTYSLNVIRDGEQLKWYFSGNRDCPYALRHYQYDTFSWLVSKDEAVRYARFPVTQPRFYLFNFSASQTDGEIDQINWINDLDVNEGEEFRKSWPETNGVRNDARM